MTARHALDTLMREGYVYRSPRRGTFVAQPRVRFSVGSFTRIMSEADYTPGTRVLACQTLDPDPVMAATLGVPVDDGRIHVIRRLRTAKGQPMAIETIYVSAKRFPDLLQHDLTGSLWDIMRTSYNVHPRRADARVLAVTLDRVDAELLDVSPDSVALLLSRTVFDANDTVIELARDVYRGDRAEFSVSAPVDDGMA